MAHKEEFPFAYLPEEIAGLTLRCADCGYAWRPNLLEKNDSSFVPLKPNDAPPDHPGRWICAGKHFPCPICNINVFLAIPRTKLQGYVHLFGDEAFRNAGAQSLTTYSLVGCSETPLLQLNERMTSLKRSFVPDHDPATWRIHLKDLWSGHNRKRHPIFATWRLDRVQQLISEMSSVLREFRKVLWVYNLAVSGPNTPEQKRQAFIGLLLYVINDTTRQGAGPRLSFDSEKPVLGENTIHGWATTLLHSYQHTLLYAFVAHSVEIPTPQFVPPGSTSCLELADFICFVVARFYFDQWNGNSPQIDTALIGPCRYAAIVGEQMLYTKSETYPWEFFYGQRSVGLVG